MAAELKKEYPFAADKVILLPNPVELERMKVPSDFDRAAFRAAHGVGADDLLLVFVALGHFERKGLPQILDAMAAMDVPRLKLCVVGGQPDDAQIAAALRRAAFRITTEMGGADVWRSFIPGDVEDLARSVEAS